MFRESQFRRSQPTSIPTFLLPDSCCSEIGVQPLETATQSLLAK